jgi:hypothetical protein
MPNRQSPRFAAHALFPVSSAILDTPYTGRKLSARPVKVAQRAHRAPAPDAIWGQFQQLSIQRSCRISNRAYRTA